MSENSRKSHQDLVVSSSKGLGLGRSGLGRCKGQKLGWDPRQEESHLDAMLRGELLTALARLGHEATLDEAIRRFHAFLEDRDSPVLPPDIRKAAYVALMRRVSTSDKLGYEALLRVYGETDLSQEKERVLDPNIVLEALNFLLSSEVRSQDAIIGLGVSVEGREIAWKWLKVNFITTYLQYMLCQNIIQKVGGPYLLAVADLCLIGFVNAWAK
ncbi:hypothetical protein Cgig2_016291 [Carnegiea gigantea]|uniref:ERAP1-like C-terminal domain-containing protein n=1 Tax=Carnegiea gigantea TaxID=171969 RepID=A0A9Q1KH26_9CARY|nr:hypothetical protein Cgig2_016291 [Carnegiea gigantea]